MKRNFAILLLAFVLCGREAYAITDIMAKIESGLKAYEDAKNEVAAVVKKVTDTATLARQGFSSATNCFKNPMQCGGVIKDVYKTGDAIKGVSSIGGKLKRGDLTDVAPTALAKSIKEDGVYKRGSGNDIKRRNELEEENNAVVADNITRLFAKGMSTRQSIRLEDDEKMYNVKFENNNMDEILFAQNKIVLNSKRRIAHILELRSYMYNAEALKELTQYKAIEGVQ